SPIPASRWSAREIQKSSQKGGPAAGRFPPRLQAHLRMRKCYVAQSVGELLSKKDDGRGQEDLNLHTLTVHAPQACASANSATTANPKLVQTSSHTYLKLVGVPRAVFCGS